MLDRENDVFSMPLAPPSAMDMEEEAMDDSSHPLTNADFRKMLMTPRDPNAPASSVQPKSHEKPKVHASSLASSSRPAKASLKIIAENEVKINDEDDAATRRKKKKMYYAKLKKEEEERQKELEKKYRDRAKERRDGPVTEEEKSDRMISTTADYRAVAPDAKGDATLAERRKQIIQESKYLGGDMEHTHLVKGLDYALLEKVRAEITSKEEEELMDRALNDADEENLPIPHVEEPEVNLEFRTKMAKNIYRTLFKRTLPEKNELFLPKRMAYVVDLEDEYETDIPTTLIRSKTECPTLEATTTLSTNDIVINKLTQILSYLRQGKRDKKLKKKEKAAKMKEEDRPKLADDSIYGEIGDYMPGFDKTKESRRERDRSDRDRRDRDGREHEHRSSRHDSRRERDRRDRHHDREHKKRSYFEKPVDEEGLVREKAPGSAKELVKSINDKFSKGWAPADIDREHKMKSQNEPHRKEDSRSKLKRKIEVDSYAECYPGMEESADAIIDSDDEVDYSKMDQGNKKGPVGRWDFDTQEEYSDYMSNKEALPKAAFQYGVKMADGRQTRRTGPKDEKRELDREWQQIQNIIAKRKETGTGKRSKKY